MLVDNQAGDFVRFIGHQRLIQKGLQWYLGQSHLRDRALLGRQRNNTGQSITGALWCRLGHQLGQIAEAEGSAAQRIAVGMRHRVTSGMQIAANVAQVTRSSGRCLKQMRCLFQRAIKIWQKCPRRPIEAL